MGPTKVIPKEGALYEVKTGKLVQDGLPTRTEQESLCGATLYCPASD